MPYIKLSKVLANNPWKFWSRFMCLNDMLGHSNAGGLVMSKARKNFEDPVKMWNRFEDIT